MTNAEIKEKLSEYLILAPEEMQRRFAVHDGNPEEFYFYGFIFRNEEVIPYDLSLFDKYDQSESYVNLKPTLLYLLKTLNLLHACVALAALIDKYHREIKVVENNIIENLKYYDPRFKSKFIWHIKKHRSRERKFIKSNKFQDDKRWNNLLIRTFNETCYSSWLGEYRNERSASFFMLYPCKHEFLANQDEYRKSLAIRKREDNRKNRGEELFDL